MAVTFEYDEDNGAGPTITHGRTETDWKNVDDSTTAFGTSPITAGNNSFEKWQYAHFTGAYNQLEAGLFAHTVGAFDSGIILKGQPAMTADADREAYTTPSTTTNANLTFVDTPVIAITAGRAVWFGITTPAAAGKAATTTAALPIFTNYLVTQIQTTGAAPAGDLTATITLGFRYDES